jgi:hypothetical protein
MRSSGMPCFVVKLFCIEKILPVEEEFFLEMASVPVPLRKPFAPFLHDSAERRLDRKTRP